MNYNASSDAKNGNLHFLIYPFATASSAFIMALPAAPRIVLCERSVNLNASYTSSAFSVT